MLARMIVFHLVLCAVIIAATRWKPGNQRKMPRKWKQRANVDDVYPQHQVQDPPYWNLVPDQEPDYQLTYNPPEDLANGNGHRGKNRKRRPIRFHRWPYGVIDHGGVRKERHRPSQKDKDDLETKWDIMLGKVSASIKPESKPDTLEDESSLQAVHVNGLIIPNEDSVMARKGPNDKGNKANKTETLGTKPNDSVANETVRSAIPLYSLITAGHCWQFQYRWLLLSLCLCMYIMDAIFIVIVIHKFYVKKELKHLRFGSVKSTGDLSAAIRSLGYDEAELLSKAMFLRLKSRNEPEILKRYFGGDRDELAEGMNFTTLISDLNCRPRLWRHRKNRSRKKSGGGKDDMSNTYLSARDMASDDEESIFEREPFLPPYAAHRNSSYFDSH